MNLNEANKILSDAITTPCEWENVLKLNTVQPDMCRMPPQPNAINDVDRKRNLTNFNSDIVERIQKIRANE